MVALTLVSRLAIVFSPIPFLLAHVVPDDAMYYLTIARNVVFTGVPTFDGIAATNGYHPLWLALLIPISALRLDPEATLRGALLLQAAFEVTSVVLLDRLARRLGAGNVAALFGACLYACSPIVLTQAGGMNGLETPLATMLLLMFLLAAARGIVGVETTVRVSAVGITGAALTLARLDMVIVVAAVAIVMLIRNRRDRRAMLRITLATLIPGAVVSAFAAINAYYFNDPIPVSATSIGWFAREVMDVYSWSLAEWGFRIGSNMLWTVRFVPFGMIAVHGTLAATSGAVIVSAWIAYRYRPSLRTSCWRPGALWLIVGLGVAWIVFVVTQTLRIPPLRSWYHGMWMAPFTLVAVRGLEAMQPGASGREAIVRTVWSLVAVLLLTIIGAYNALVREGRDGAKREMAKVMARMLPPGTLVGSWNAGTIAHFAPTIRVVNLDGAVNNRAWVYIQLRSLDTYRRAIGIDYLVDDLGSYHAWSRCWTPTGAPILEDATVLVRIPIPDTDDTIALSKMAPR